MMLMIKEKKIIKNRSDCFGKGQIRHVIDGDYRHRPKEALLFFFNCLFFRGVLGI